jgi:hypothetical protein
MKPGHVLLVNLPQTITDLVGEFTDRFGLDQPQTEQGT